MEKPTTAVAPREAAYIERAITGLCGRIEHVAEMVDKLEARISPALLDRLPDGGAGQTTAAAPVPGSHLAVVLSGQVDLLDNILDRLDSIYRRVDI